MSRRRDEIRARLDAATPGPWKPYREAADWGSIHIGTRNTASIYADEDGGYMADRDLIAHAPADIAFLLSENEALREQIGFLHEDAGESRLVVRSPQERVWEVWRTTRDRKVATFRTKREATAYVEGGGDE